MLVFFLNILSAISAIFAAYFWWKSASVEVPKDFGVGSWVAENAEELPNPEKNWAWETAKYGAKGAIFAAFSALAMAASTLMGMDWSKLQ